VEIAEFLAAANLEDMLEEDRKKELKARKKQFQKMRKTFLDADTDGDGHITKEEHEMLFAKAGDDVTDYAIQAYMEEIWGELDKDGDGQVSMLEFLAVANLETMLEDEKAQEVAKQKKEFEKMTHMFEDADADGSGCLTVEEQATLFANAREVIVDERVLAYMERQWHELDQDGENAILYYVHCTALHCWTRTVRTLYCTTYSTYTALHTTHCSLLTTHSALRTTHYALRTTHYSY
jgi:Ca2+-binding EF-hand superfamily protein